MNIKLIYILLLISVNTLNAQTTEPYDGKYGGPFFAFTHNKLGSSLSFGGGGTFIIRKDFYIGIFGQSMSSIIEKKTKLPNYQDFDIKSRFTGTFIGYFQEFKNTNRFYIYYYSKIGFGQVYIDNPNTNSTIYDSSILFSPHIEPVISVTSFLKIGVGIFYDIYTGVKLLDYRNSDFNSFGFNLNIRFVAS